MPAEHRIAASTACRNCRYNHIDAGCGSYAPVSYAESLFYRALRWWRRVY